MGADKAGQFALRSDSIEPQILKLQFERFPIDFAFGDQRSFFRLEWIHSNASSNARSFLNWPRVSSNGSRFSSDLRLKNKKPAPPRYKTVKPAATKRRYCSANKKMMVALSNSNPIIP